MTYVRDRIIVRAEDIIGREIRYSSIRPSLFGSFDIRDVHILDKDQIGEPLLSVNRLRIFFSLPDLLRGKITAVKGVQLEHPLINMDFIKDRDILELFSLAENREQGVNSDKLQEIRDLLPARMDFQVRNGFFNFRDSFAVLRISGMNFDLRSDEIQITLNGKFKTNISVPALFNRSYSANMDVSLNGAVSSGLEEGSATIDIVSMTGEEKVQIFKVQPISFGVLLEGKTLSLSYYSDNQPFNFFASYNTATGALVSGIKLQNFHPAGFVSFSGPWSAGNHWLDHKIEGNAEFEKNNGDMRYHIDISGGLDGALADSFEIHASGSEKLAVVEEFRFSSSVVAGLSTGPEGEVSRAGVRFFQGMFGFRGSIGFAPVAASGLVSFDNFSLTGINSFSTVMNVKTSGNIISISGENSAMGPIVLDNLDITLTPAENEFGFEIVASRLRETGYGRIKPESLSLEASMSYEQQQLDARLAMDSFSAADLSDLFSPFVREANIPAFVQAVLRDVSVTTEIFFTTDFTHILYNTPSLTIALENDAYGSMGIFSVSGTGNHFSLNEGRFVRADNILLFSAYADYSNPSDLDFAINASYENLSWFLEGRFLDHKTVSIHGSHGLHAFVSADNSGAFSGYFESNNLPIPMKIQPAYLSFYASVRYDSWDFWSFDVDRLEITDIYRPAGTGRMVISGSVDQDGASFPLFYYSDDISPLYGSADFSWTKDFSDLRGTISMSEGPGRAEYYHLDCLLKKEQFDLQVSATGMRLDRLYTKAGKAIVDGEFSIIWDMPASYRAIFRLNSFKANIYDTEILVSAIASLDSNEFLMRNLNFEFAGLNAKISSLSLNLDGNIAVTGANLQGHINENNVEGTFDFAARFRPVDSWLEIAQSINSFDGTLHVDNFRYADIASAEPFDFQFAHNYGAFSVSGGPKNMLRFQADSEGNFYAALSGPSPVRGSAIGSVRDDYIDARCSDLYVDLAGIWALAPKFPTLRLAAAL